MRLIDANKAHNGLTIVAKSQYGGKGQRGRTWVDEPGKSILMTIISSPEMAIGRQFEFNACIAVAVANVLQKLSDEWHVAIKWPNDIIINDKKAAGILIENIIRGQIWSHSVIGLGINMHQEGFPPELPFATSLKIESGTEYDSGDLVVKLQEAIVAEASRHRSQEVIFREYNKRLYKRGGRQGFSDQSGKWEAEITDVTPDGALNVKTDGGEAVKYFHGQVTWDWI